MSERRRGLFDGCPEDPGGSPPEERVAEWILASPPLRALTLRWLGPLANSQDAEDTLLELCVRLPRILGRYSETRGPLGPFLGKCLRNLCGEVRDKLQRRSRVEAPHPLWGGDEGEATPVEFKDKSPDANPGSQADAADLCRALDRILRGLPENQRRAWELRHLDGLSYEEIARTLRVPRGSVAAWLNRARSRIIAEMLEQMRDTPADEGGSA